MDWLRRLALRFALGSNDYKLLVSTCRQDPRLPRAYLVNIVVRKDGVEKTSEADWAKRMARLVDPSKLDRSCTPGAGKCTNANCVRQ